MWKICNFCVKIQPISKFRAKKALYFTGNFFTNFDAEIQILKINLPQDIFSKVKFEISGFVTNLRLMQ